MEGFAKESVEVIQREVMLLMRRADYKKTLDGEKDSLDRSGYLLLDYLHESGDVPIKRIADVFQLDISTVSRQVVALEKKGFVQRRPDQKDKRVSVISITDDGKLTIAAAKDQRIKAYDEILEGWSEDDKDTLALLLARLNRKMEQRKKIR